jgi:hypothetical protein
MNHDEQQAEIARLKKAVDDALCERDACCDDYQREAARAVEAEATIAAKDRDIQALRGELAILMEVVEALPDELLDKVPEAKLLRAFQAMTEADKRKILDTVIDRQAAEIESWKARFKLVNEALRLSIGSNGAVSPLFDRTDKWEERQDAAKKAKTEDDGS